MASAFCAAFSVFAPSLVSAQEAAPRPSASVQPPVATSDAASQAAVDTARATYPDPAAPIALPSPTTAMEEEGSPRTQPAREFGRIGIALKSGENAGPLGIQAAWNFNAHLQMAAAVGGVADPFQDPSRARTDSYSLQGKVYLEHLYFAVGYVRKVSIFEEVVLQEPNRVTRAEDGAAMHMGYEFGNRRGFYFATSAGYIWLLGGGGRPLTSGISDPFNPNTSAVSGASFGASVGYYLW